MSKVFELDQHVSNMIALAGEYVSEIDSGKGQYSLEDKKEPDYIKCSDAQEVFAGFPIAGPIKVLVTVKRGQVIAVRSNISLECTVIDLDALEDGAVSETIEEVKPL